MDRIPEWLTVTDSYNATSDRDGFMTKSLLSIIGALTSFRAKSKVFGTSIPAQVKLLICLALIIAVNAFHNMFYVSIILAAVLVTMCFLPSDLLVRTFAGAAGAAFFTALIMLPAVFLGSPSSIIVMPVKVFTSVGLVGLLAATTEWNNLTACLASFHIPSIFIFTLDITLKYIVILGNICVDMLNAVRLRSVGRNKDKKSALSGVMGVTFLKSREMADEMYQAMVCRGFDGEYNNVKRES